MERRYEVLSRFHYGLSDDLVTTTWKVRLLPNQIEDAVKVGFDISPGQSLCEGVHW